MATMKKAEKTTQGLDKGGWSTAVHRALQDFLNHSSGGGAPVVFDFDNTCILGDIGELFGHFLVEEMRYRYDLDEFWQLIDPADGRDRLRKITEAALAIDPSRRKSSPVYHRYLVDMAGLYGRRLCRLGTRDCYEWAVRLHVGLTEDQMTAWSTAAIKAELNGPREMQRVRDPDGSEFSIQRGIRPFREIQDLMNALNQAGFEVWIVSASNIWTVRSFAHLLGVPAERVLGNRVEVHQDRLTAQIRDPALYREGKVTTIEREVGACPVFAAGDAMTDYEMLCQASELALVIDRGDEFLRSEGAERGWAVQPQTSLTGKWSDEVETNEVKS